MKRFMAATLTILLVSTTAFAQAADNMQGQEERDHRQHRQCDRGQHHQQQRNGHSGRRSAVVGGLAGTAA